MGSLLIPVVLLVVCMPALYLFSSQVVKASSNVMQHSKLPFPSSSLTSSATPPPSTISRYITQIDVNTPSRLNTDGCNQAKAVLGHALFLDFGDTAYQNGGYGTFLPGNTSFVSNSTIIALAEQYVAGYATCDTNTTLHLVLAIGTTNKGSFLISTANATNAGQEWGKLVAKISSWAISQGFGSKLYIWGASNMTLENNTAAITRAWTDGFDKTYSTSKVRYVDYGDAAGCPTVDSTTSQPCSNGWTQDDVAYVSWVAQAAYPLPQIFDTAGIAALQWQSIEYYQRSNPNLGTAMYVQGAETQYEACLQQGGCQGTNNTPSQGWQQLYNALQTSSVTAQPRLWDATDFQWDN